MGCINPQALVARRPGITIISYFSRADGSRPAWSGSALRGGTGMLALSAFTVALVEKLQAHNVDFSDFTNDPLSYSGLPAGIFEIVTDETIPRVIIVDKPDVTVVIHPRGSGLTVEQHINSSAQMLDLLAASRDALATFLRGQQDSFVQRRADLNDQ